jgi:hypothetical protein
MMRHSDEAGLAREAANKRAETRVVLQQEPGTRMPTIREQSHPLESAAR